MSDVKWIKIATDIFDNKKIKLIESMPDGDTIIVIWFKILVLAGTVNDDGSVYFTKDIPFTEQMLSTVFDRPLPVIQLALATFERFGMIEIVNDIIRVSNWEKYQNIDGLERVREQARVRMERYRERKKLEDKRGCYATSDATVTDGYALDIEEEKERDKEKEKVLKDISSESSPFILIPLNDGSEHPVSTKEVEEYKSLYPNVDVEQALRSMRGWCISNPTKRKTKRGVRNFITSWLSREQDRGRKPQPKKPTFVDIPQQDIDFDDLEKRFVAN